ncbi:hypothetical protein RJ640_001339 [Escallonia rubra]|uniref:DUF7788 domain-containing protein n=1 Tax=Escallonia rubra TaxID=112253 RepID=A0AA88QK10_9ASTE|nr:hypothetical protein RJ640_001339 [Escallonia rubra]
MVVGPPLETPVFFSVAGLHPENFMVVGPHPGTPVFFSVVGPHPETFMVFGPHPGTHALFLVAGPHPETFMVVGPHPGTPVFFSVTEPYPEDSCLLFSRRTSPQDVYGRRTSPRDSCLSLFRSSPATAPPPTVASFTGAASGNSDMMVKKVFVALGLLISELSKEPWKGKLITFSEKLRLISIQGKYLLFKSDFVRDIECGANTNFQKVFDLILQVAVNRKLKNSLVDIPRTWLLCSWRKLGF